MTLQEILADIKSPRKKKVILDTDTFNEVDDQFAVAYAYLSDKIDLLAVNAAPFHNEKCSSFAEGMELSYQEIHKILALTDPDYKTPVFRGSCERITDTKTYVESPACDNIIKTVHESCNRMLHKYCQRYHEGPLHYGEHDLRMAWSK